MELHPPVAPLHPSAVLQDVPQKDPKFKRGREKKNTWHRINEPVGPNDIVTSVTSCSSWLHAGCEHSPTLPQVMLQLLIRRQGTEITAVNVLPGTMCAAASSMLSSLGTDRHKPIQQLMSQKLLVAWNFNPALHPAAE